MVDESEKLKQDPHKNWANKQIWKLVHKWIGFDASVGMEIYLIWLKNPKWVYKK